MQDQIRYVAVNNQQKIAINVIQKPCPRQHYHLDSWGQHNKSYLKWLLHVF